MKNSKLLLLTWLAYILFSCNDDDKEHSIVGKWTGTKIDYVISYAAFPVPITNTIDDYSDVLEFNGDGSVTYTKNSQITSGTYEIQNNTLTTTLNLQGTLPLSTGKFTIKRLNATELQLAVQEEGEIELPDYGTFEGALQATLFFRKE